MRADVALVGFPGHADVALTRLAALARSSPVIFDAFVSLYETAVDDRAHIPPGSVGALRCVVEDRLACRLASLVMVDTDTHGRYFADEVGVPCRKLRRLWVGADDDVMRPVAAPCDEDTGGRFRVFVYGNFAPLHGLEHVVRAASALERRREAVDVDIVGAGQTEADVRRVAAELGVGRVRFLGRLPYEELAGLMARAHVCLGIFGTSDKAARVIPNKVFDALAVGRPVITADTPAAREALAHGKTAWLCPAGEPDALADAITSLRADERTRERIARNGHQLYRERFSIDALSRDVAHIVQEALGRMS